MNYNHYFILKMYHHYTCVVITTIFFLIFSLWNPKCLQTKKVANVPSGCPCPIRISILSLIMGIIACMIVEYKPIRTNKPLRSLLRRK
jgi:hypothetical protein